MSKKPQVKPAGRVIIKEGTECLVVHFPSLTLVRFQRSLFVKVMFLEEINPRKG